ncbi:MAG TPA: RloB family protein [bacterium]|nr:RloB family protein [bacterium]HPS31477.1 RloB family protein [bacterium]
MPKKRLQSVRQYKKQIVIACEGEKTERNYLNRFKMLCELENVVKVKLLPHEHTSAKELVEDVLRYKEAGNDELWIVCDKDGYTKHHEAFCTAKEKGVKIAFSSISFEYWLLLHFKYTAHSFTKSKDVEDYLKKMVYLPKYDKADENVFDKIKDKTQTAIDNAKKLRKAAKTANYDNCKIYELNPYTNVDELLYAIESLRSEYQRNPAFLFKY